MAYRAVLTSAAEGRDPLIKLWTENLPVHGDPDAKLQWFYVDAPSGPGEAFLLRADDGAAIGCAGLSTREVVYRGTVIRAALLADFAIDRQHRSGLPALVLQRAVKRHVEATYAFSYGYPNANAVAIHKRTGYQVLGKMARFVRVLRHASFIERRYGWTRRSRMAGAIVDRAAVAASLARAVPSRRRHELRWEIDFDERWDHLWELGAEAAGIACRRSARFLRWRFLRKPNERNAIAALVERSTNAVAAYAVVRGTADHPAELVDFFGASSEALDVLLGQLVPALYRRGHSSVELHYLGHPRIHEVLARHWFSLRDAERVVIVNPSAGCPIDPAVLCDSTAWYMTDLDEDT